MIRAGEQWLIAWLLRASPADEPLFGDLLEEFSRSRSRTWFWRQLVYGVAIATSRRAWATKRAIAEAWAVGCAMLAVLLFATYVTASLGMLVVNLAWMKLLAAS